MEKRRQKIALANAEVRRIVERWQDGEQVTDEEYLRLRNLYLNAATDEAAEAYMYVMTNFLGQKVLRCILDAYAYYDLDLTDQNKQAGAAAAMGAVLFADETMVRGDVGVRVPSRFERVVRETVKAVFWAFTTARFIDLPRDENSFKAQLEDEWWRLLRYGNGLYGFTVIPLIDMEDLVRYQQLGGGDDLVSWSISNWVIWSMKAFPLPIQTVIPEFAEKAYGERLRAMYEPLVASYAARMQYRAKVVYDGHDVPDRNAVVGELGALLQRAIEDYDFMYKKADAMFSSAGAVGPASSPRWRQALDERFAEFKLPFSSRDLVHVGFTRYIVGKFDEHVRESYPRFDVPSFETMDVPGTMVESDGETEEVFREESSRTGSRSNSGPGIRVAFEKGGTAYLYIQQMAFVCGPDITEDQLRNWDRRGHLETLRMRNIDPRAPATIADRRVYPYTDEMIAQIQELAERKEMLQANPEQRLLSRKKAADRLGITARTLDNWRKQGEIGHVKMEHRVFIPEAEVERLLSEREAQ